MSAEECGCWPLEAVYAFVEGASDHGTAEQIRSHAETCEACRSAVLEALQLRTLSGNLGRNRLNHRDLERIQRWTQNTLSLLRDRTAPPQ